MILKRVIGERPDQKYYPFCVIHPHTGVCVEQDPASSPVYNTLYLFSFSPLAPPDVALLDIGLPEMDGYELAAALRAQQPDPPLGLIALSGYGQPADRSRSVAAGFSAHLVKPVDLAALQDAISRASVDR
jgi:CheY-like chemotaxis protein